MKIAENIYWTGAVDWNIRHFHGHTYTTSRGTTYNAYLIKDSSTALIDTVDIHFLDGFLDDLSRLTRMDEISYIIMNHAEGDHSGALPALLDLCPGAKIVGTARCRDALSLLYHRDMDFQCVKTGDSISLGEKTLSFIEAPMLHWPDSMFTYVAPDRILMSNDAFGQHYASSERFDDQVDESILMDEASKYYGNILWPLSSLVLRKLEELRGSGTAVDMIAPSHGIIWRRGPSRIIDAYGRWAANTTEPSIVMIYETMWGATAKMARAIMQGITEKGVRARLFDINSSDRSEIIKEMLSARGYAIGSSTHDNGMLSNMAGFLHFLKGLKPKKREALVFGSYGWGKGACSSMASIMREAGIEISAGPLEIQYVPDGEGLERCRDIGRDFAQKILKKEA